MILPILRPGSTPRKTTGGRCFALLAPRSLRPSGHLRCASSTPPGVSVVSAHICGKAAIIRDGAARQCQSRPGGMTAVSSHFCGGLPRRRRAAHRLEPPSSGIRPLLGNGAAHLRLGTTRRSSLHLEQRGRLPCVRRGSLQWRAGLFKTLPPAFMSCFHRSFW